VKADGFTITKQAYLDKVNSTIETLEKGGKLTDDQKEQVRKQTLDEMIEAQIAKMECVKLGIDVDKLVAENQKINPVADVNESYIHKLMIQKIIDVKKDPTALDVSDQEVQDFEKAHPDYLPYPETVKANIIYAHVYPSDSEARKKAKKEVLDALWLKMANHEITFEDAEKKWSDQKQEIGLDGKLIPYVFTKEDDQKVEDLPEPEKTIFKYEMIDLPSQVLTMPQGYCIIEIVEHKPPYRLPLELCKEAIHQLIAFDKKKKLDKKVIDQLRKEYNVQVLIKDFNN
jgi:hypothetical protein